MKVEFSSASLHSIPQNRNIGVRSSKKINTTLGNSERLGPVVRISFKGNFTKNYRQVASIAPEDKGLGLPEYNKGGLAVVAKEAPESWNVDLGADTRTFLPYHSYDNPNGGVKVLRVSYDQNGKPLPTAPAENFKAVRLDYQLQEGEEFVIQSAPKDGNSPYRVLKKLDVSGSIDRIRANDLSGEKVNYQLFQVIHHDSPVTRYIMHTPDMAKFNSAYSGAEAYGGNTGQAYNTGKAYNNATGAGTSAVGNTGQAYSNAGGAYGRSLNSDALYAENSRAIIDALPKLSSKEHGNFNPANIWLHDRFAFPAAIEIAEQSANGNPAFDGVRIHNTLHNPGRAYQGYYYSPQEFLRIVAGKHAIDDLTRHPQYQLLRQIDAKIAANTATEQERQIVYSIIDPAIQHFKDSLGSYNMTAIAPVGRIMNPANISYGTVSLYYEEEMKELDDISLGLRGFFNKANMISVTNGSSPASLRLHDDTANFGDANTGLSQNKSGFRTYKPRFDEKTGALVNVDEVIEAKQHNKKWLINLIANTDASDPHSLQKLFFIKEMYTTPDKTPATVLGRFSPYQDGDRLIIGWGRPDPQKGMPTTFESFLRFLQDPTVSEETKIHTKLIAGAGVWDNNARDWLNVKRLISEIQQLDGGRYAGNVMYVNGFFPNRLVGCADFSVFTSTYEPCGITPLESYSAGTPVISIRTGGAPNFITSLASSSETVTNQSGFLTEHAYMRNIEDLEGITLTKEQVSKLDDHIKFDLIDNARREASSKEIAACMKTALDVDTVNYRQMTTNTLQQNISWSGNTAYNNGSSANTVYWQRIFHVNEKDFTPLPHMERNTAPFNRMIGSYGLCDQSLISNIIEKAKTIHQEVASTAKASKWGKVITAGTVGIIALGTGSMVYLNNLRAKNIANQIDQQTTNKFSQIG